METLRALPAALALSLAVLLLVGCSTAEEDGPAPSETALVGGARDDEGGLATARAVSDAVGSSFEVKMDGPHLAIVVNQGADCDEDGCREVFELSADGRWLFRGSAGPSQTGSYDPGELTALAGAVDQTTIVNGPFRGECPTEFGGKERFYVVYAPDDPGTVVLDVASCRDQLDAGAPILVALDLLVTAAATAA